MNQWPMVKLGDVCDIKIGKTPARKNKAYWGVGTPWLSIKDMNQGAALSTTSEQITDLAVRELNITPYPAGTVFFSFKLSIGKVGISTIELFTNEAIAAILPKDSTSLDKNFLMEALRVSGNLTSGNDAVLGQTLNKKSLQQISIPLPPLEEQRRIAQILQLVDFQKHTVRHVLSVTFKSLRTSIFHRVSSGPAVEERRLSEICDLYGGASLPKGIPFDNTKDGLLLMKVSDMNEKGNERHIHSTAVHVPSIPENLPNSIAPAHTVVLPKRGAAIATNKKRLTTRYTMLDPNLIGVRCKTPAVNSTYLYEWFENFDLTTITSGSSIPQLNKKDLNPLLIPIPSTTALQGFTGASSKIDEIEQHVRDKLALLEELHQSLATRAFAGQL